MSGQSGKGNSSAQTTQTAENEQVGVTSGIGIGANSSGNKINIQSDSPEIAKTLSDQAGHVADVSAQVNALAISEVGNTAGLAIAGANNLATKFGDDLTQVNNSNVGLLTSVAQELSNTTSQSLDVSKSALDSSFAVSRAVAPQNDNFTVSDTIGTVGKYVAVAAVAIAFIFFFRKK